MNCKRFTARTSRDALSLVRQAFGEDAVVLSTKPCPEGVEVLAMPPDGMAHIERMSKSAPRYDGGSESRFPADAAESRFGADAGHSRFGAEAGASRFGADAMAPRQAGRGARVEAQSPATPVEEDVRKLSMSTLSFQDFVRERMLRRRKDAISEASRFPDDAADPLPAWAQPSTPARAAAPAAAARPATNAATVAAPARTAASAPMVTAHAAASHTPHYAPDAYSAPTHQPATAHAAMPTATAAPERPSVLGARMAEPGAAMAGTAAMPREAPRLNDEVRLAAEAQAVAASRREQETMITELRQVRGLIEERFGALAFMEKLQRHPKQALLTQKLLDCGFSPALIRKLAEALPMDVADETAWASGVLERNLVTAEHDAALEDHGGVYALVGPTGVGKTTTTAKLAAAFATKYGAGNLGLITLDAYRVGAHEQLRAYGRILGVPVHTAHDRASLEDLLELLAGKKMVLIDTAGMAQRDARTRELLDMVQHRTVQRLLVVNTASQGETIEDVLVAYRANACAGVVLSKMDEAVKLGPALDALIRHKLKVVGVANGQRVPEDWHRLSANALVHRALRGGGSPAYKLDAGDVNLIFAAQRLGALHTPNVRAASFA
jgi:flagellar biosynthesis protein FlhF